MKRTLLIASLIVSTAAFAQEPVEEKKDTTRINLGGIEMIIIDKREGEDDDQELKKDSAEHKKHKEKSEAHWAGLDFGFTTLFNADMNTSFPTTKYFQNDVAKSQVWNLNLLEHKFKIAKHYMGLTTGLGFSFTSVAFRDNYLLTETPDTLFAVSDTMTTYSKNKLKATYLTVPLLLEFNTHANSDKSFYIAAGVVGGVRIASKVKRVGELNGKKFEEKTKGAYGLNPFKLDAAVRLGYGSWGVFANYSLLPLFDTDKTVEVYPLTFGLSLNF